MRKWSLALPAIVLWLFLFPVYRDRVPAFGCFDDCFNYLAGYFLNYGKNLYGEIFYNHQPIMAYLSAMIQKVGRPETIYALVFQHRLATLTWSIGWDLWLTLRFGWVGLAFAVIFETTKGFLFGERFLAEALIVYPLVYLVGLLWQKRPKLPLAEALLGTMAAWFVVFAREPFIPLALVLWGLLVWPRRSEPTARLAMVFFVALSAIIILVHPVKDYFFQVVSVNLASVGGSEARSTGFLGKGGLAVLFSPVVIFLGGSDNLFRHIEVGLAVVFWLAVAILREWKKLALAGLVLALANLRPVAPGAIYYAAFHALVWYGTFVFITLLLTSEVWRNHYRLGKLLLGGVVIVILVAVTSPSSYLFDKVDRQAEFTANFGHYYVTGEVVRILSEPTDTLFLDGWDDLIYWQAKRLSPYPYSWYTSVMPQFSQFREARLAMFASSPPDFYYGRCQDKLVSELPKEVDGDYRRFFWKGRPTCLYVHRVKAAKIATERFEQALQQFDYTLR